MADDATQIYLENLPAKFQGICTKLHALARSQMPDAYVIVYHGALGYSTSPSPSGLIVYIAPQRDWVNLGFYNGVGIPDPHKLLIGEGVRMRHIKITTEEETKNPALPKLLTAAWKKAPQDVADRLARRKKRNR